eukprot:TRINITY_DN1092_c0_g1_i2.p1 TRINITY_DN1092_c0_g1~~TRINITY_DN1092_c0_g1_i2.p1  ORF type:complete len:360 (-),score=87.28 TRINITY_DN1092_c0_g1_i2:923-1954(-)
MEPGVESSSLRSVFDRCQSEFYRLEDSSGPDVQREATKTLGDFEKCRQLIDTAGIFSPNEELEDISTGQLRYLLVTYYIGELHTKIGESRLRHAQETVKYLRTFLRRCEQYKLVDKEDLKAIHGEGSTDSNARRMEKISRAKREKQVEKQLQELLSKQQKAQNLNAKGYLTKPKEDDDDEDDEDTREIMLAIIKSSIYKGITSLDMNEQEFSMLLQIEKEKQKHGGQLPPEPPRQAPFKNFTIHPNTREEVYRDVFKIVNPATMTPEQWAEEQMALGLLPTPEGAAKAQAENDQKEREKKEKEYDEDEDEVDKKTMKDRNWADWKDEHPYGEGNKNDHYFRRG